MPYLVQACEPSGKVEQSKAAVDRREALSVALEWFRLGYINIRIIGNGRIYTAEQLALEVINEDPHSVARES
jgi:hypothetical protein